MLELHFIHLKAQTDIYVRYHCVTVINKPAVLPLLSQCFSVYNLVLFLRFLRVYDTEKQNIKDDAIL